MIINDCKARYRKASFCAMYTSFVYTKLKIKARALLIASFDARNMRRSGRKSRNFLCCFRLDDLVFRWKHMYDALFASRDQTLRRKMCTLFLLFYLNTICNKYKYLNNLNNLIDI